MRFQQQIIFEKIGAEGQKKLQKSTVCILGLGALGSRAAELLTRAGIGTLILIDRDVVELLNLQRQTLYTEQDLNLPKVYQAAIHLKQINSKIKIKPFFKDINYTNIESFVKGDLVLDCTDNLETRFLLNEHCLEKEIPWIFSSVLGSIGMLFNIIPKKTPCFSCIFSEPEDILGTCDTEGILNTTPTLISALQVTEAIKILTKQPYAKELLYYDLWKHKLTKTKIKKNPKCNACKGKYSYLNGEKNKEVIKLCGTNSYQLKGYKPDLKKTAEKLEKIDKVIVNDYCLLFKELTILKDGRVLIKAKSEKEAKELYSKYLGD